MATEYNHIPNISKEITLSVIITFYNQAEFVDKCLGTVFSQQTSFSFEVIVVDDGSTDETKSCIKSWIDKYPKHIKFFEVDSPDSRSDQIARVSKCRLLGLSNACGKYITFLDGDDYYPCTSKFELQLSMLEKHPSCCACLSSYMSTVEGRDTTIKRISCGTVLKTRKYVEFCYLPSATMIYRNMPFVCFDDNFDDNSISFQLFSSGKLCYVNEVTFCHYKTSCSSWLRKDENQKNIALIKNIDDAIRFSSIPHSSIYFRHISFLLSLYKKRKLLNGDKIQIDRKLNSRLLYCIINYRDINPLSKIILKINCGIMILMYKVRHYLWLKRRTKVYEN